MKRSRGLLALCWLLYGGGCPSPNPTDPSDAGVRPVDGSMRVDVGRSDACVPTACPATACGSVANGCGGMQMCSGGCVCTAADFRTTCPERACEVVTGCGPDGACTYEPVTCGSERCVCPAGTSCENTDPRFCGDTCGATVCDPQPTTSGGVTRFANACVPTAEAACGLCGLGRLACDGTTSLQCTAPAIPGLRAATAECEGSLPTASIVYFDASYLADDSDGSRERPYRDFDAAVGGAGLRGARAIIIGGAPTITHALDVVDGVSIVGGYTGWPDWRPTTIPRPVFIATETTTSSDGRRLVGLTASNLSLPTALFHIEVRTANLSGTDAASNVGAVLTAADRLEMHDVTFTVGDAAGGAAGTPGSAGAAGARGMDGVGAVSDYLFPPSVCRTIREWNAVGEGAVGGTSSCGAAGGAGGRALHGLARWTRDPGASVGTAPGGNNVVIDGLDAAPFAASGAASGSVVPATLTLDTRGLPTVRTGAGGVGITGAAGGGGAGGASGPVVAEECAADYFGRYPATGGGGGAGGCGGTGGTAGSPGGWVLGIVAVDSPMAVFDGVTLTLGTPGPGGAGGLGGAGGAGAPGGAGGPDISGVGAMYLAGNGGAGVRGQQGGRGAAGACGQRTPVVTSGTAPTLTGVSMAGAPVTATSAPATVATSCTSCPITIGACTTTGTFDCSGATCMCSSPAEVCNAVDDDCVGGCDNIAGCRVGVHRQYSDAAGVVYGTSLVAGVPVEVMNAFDVMTVPADGTLPLNRCRLASGVRSVTTGVTCSTGVLEARIGYIATTPTCGAIALHGVAVGSTILVTTDELERRAAVSLPGAVSLGIFGYVWTR